MLFVAQRPLWRELVGWSLRLVLAVCLLVGVVGIGAQSALAAATAYVANYTDGTLTPIATGTNLPGRPFSAGVGPQAMAMTSDGKTAYVADGTASQVGVINLAAERVTHRIAVGADPVAIALTPDGKNAYVAEAGSGQVQEINLTTNTVIHAIAAGSDPTGLAITPDGKTVYVTCGYGSFDVVAIATATNLITGTISTSTYWPPAAISITPDGKTAFVPTSPNYHSDKSPVDVIDLATNTIVNAVWPGGYPTSVAITPDGKTAYVVGDGGAFPFADAIDVATDAVTARIALPGTNSNAAIAMTPEGMTAYVALPNNSPTTPGTVVPIALATNTVGTPIRVGADPDAIAISNLGNVAPVLTYANGKITWSAQPGVTDYSGAISTAPRGAVGRTTTYQDLGNVASWTPTPQPGKMLYYGVASNGPSGQEWTATEIAITWPTSNVAPVLTISCNKISCPPARRERKGLGDTGSAPSPTTTRL